MHQRDSPEPKNRTLTQRSRPNLSQGRRELTVYCQVGDLIQVGNSVEVIVLDVRDDEVVLDVDDKLATVRFVNEEQSTVLLPLKIVSFFTMLATNGSGPRFFER